MIAAPRNGARESSKRRLGCAAQQEELAARIVAEGMSVRATEEAVVLLPHKCAVITQAGAAPPLQAPGLQDPGVP